MVGSLDSGSIRMRIVIVPIRRTLGSVAGGRMFPRRDSLEKLGLCLLV